jgi:hypothetical protein
MAQASVFRAYDEIASFFARGPSSEEIAAFRLSDRSIERIRDLLEKNSAGNLTAEEQEELDDVGHLNRLLLLIRSRITASGTSAFDGAQGADAAGPNSGATSNGAR